MSSTNVHSEKEKRKNFEVASGETISDEQGKIEIPPVATVRGSIILAEIENGNFMNIPAGVGTLDRNGKCVDVNGRLVANYKETEIKEIFRKADKKQEKITGLKETGKRSDIDSARE